MHTRFGKIQRNYRQRFLSTKQLLFIVVDCLKFRIFFSCILLSFLYPLCLPDFANVFYPFRSKNINRHSVTFQHFFNTSSLPYTPCKSSASKKASKNYQKSLRLAVLLLFVELFDHPFCQKPIILAGRTLFRGDGFALIG